MLSAISLQRLSEVHPELSRRASQFAQLMEAQGYPIQITQGLRSWAQQDALFAQGRTAPGPKVTNAPGGYSNHCFGIAIDVCPFDGPKPDWNVSHPDWQAILRIAPTVGLRDGISFRDEPHLELVEVSPIPTDEMRQTFKDAGVTSVWAELNIPVFSF